MIKPNFWEWMKGFEDRYTVAQLDLMEKGFNNGVEGDNFRKEYFETLSDGEKFLVNWCRDVGRSLDNTNHRNREAKLTFSDAVKHLVRLDITSQQQEMLEFFKTFNPKTQRNIVYTLGSMFQLLEYRIDCKHETLSKDDDWNRTCAICGSTSMKTKNPEYNEDAMFDGNPEYIWERFRSY